MIIYNLVIQINLYKNKNNNLFNKIIIKLFIFMLAYFDLIIIHIKNKYYLKNFNDNGNK